MAYVTMLSDGYVGVAAFRNLWRFFRRKKFFKALQTTIIHIILVVFKL